MGLAMGLCQLVTKAQSEVRNLLHSLSILFYNKQRYLVFNQSMIHEAHTMAYGREALESFTSLLESSGK